MASEPNKWKVCLVHNAYARPSGEEVVVNALEELLAGRGHPVIRFHRGSDTIASIPLGRARAFLAGLHNPFAVSDLRKLLREHRPDIVHVHNLYPWISPSILPECSRQGVPVVMTVHNYRLACPSGLFLHAGRPCARCRGGREYWCLLKNCQDDWLKSFGYALRSWAARRRGCFLNHVSIFIVMSGFQRRCLLEEGFPADRLAVIPHMVSAPAEPCRAEGGQYAGFVGRVSPEKGIATLLAAARQLPDIPFHLAGSTQRMPHLPAQAPPNVKFLGHLVGDRMDAFYRRCRMLVLPSECPETFLMSIAEAMGMALPVVASRIGALEEIVQEGRTGLMFTPGDAEGLARQVRYLWNNPELCAKMGQAARTVALDDYSPRNCYERIMDVYRRAIYAEGTGPIPAGREEKAAT